MDTEEEDSNPVIKIVKIDKHEGKYRYSVERADGTTEWISEESCCQYLDCLVRFTSRGIEQTELSEEMEAESKDNESLSEEADSDQLELRNDSEAMEVMSANPDGHRSLNAAATGKKEGVTLMKSDQKEKLIQDVKKIIDVRLRDNVIEYRVVWRVATYKTKTAWIPVDGFANVRGKYLIDAYESHLHQNKKKKKLPVKPEGAPQNSEKLTKFWERFGATELKESDEWRGPKKERDGSKHAMPKEMT